jgi:hypothetical protein
MKEIINRAAEELLNAAARLQELASKIEEQPVTKLDLQNLSPEDEEKLAQLFNAWTQKNIESKMEGLEEKYEALDSRVDEFPDPSTIRDIVDKVEYKDLDKMDVLDDYDLEHIQDRANEAHDKAESLGHQLEAFAENLGPLTALAGILNLELLVDNLQAGIEAKAKNEEERERAGNGSHSS